MWLFTVYGFFSIVADKNDPTKVQIRARDEAHLITLQARFGCAPQYAIVATPDADYPYRWIVGTATARMIVAMLLIDVSERPIVNFKSAAHAARPNDAAYVGLLHRTWAIIRGAIDARFNKPTGAPWSPYGFDRAPDVDPVATVDLGWGDDFDPDFDASVTRRNLR